MFNENWEVLAVHHAAGPGILKLNGQPGTYAVSEGIWIQSIAQAVRGSQTSSRVRDRT